MKVICRFKSEEVEVEWNKEDYMNIDFNGRYLIQVDKYLNPTGLAIDGFGNRISFKPSEFIWKRVISKS